MKIAPLTRETARVGSGTVSKAELALAGALREVSPRPGRRRSRGLAAFIRAAVQKRRAPCGRPPDRTRAPASAGQASSTRVTMAAASNSAGREAVGRASPPRISITDSLLASNHSFPRRAANRLRRRGVPADEERCQLRARPAERRGARLLAEHLGSGAGRPRQRA